MKRATKQILYKVYKIGEPIVVCIEFLQRLWAWLPILWRDRDWDYGFLLEIMKFKMNRMANCIEDNDFIMGASRYARQLRYAAYLTDVMRDGEALPRVKALHDALEAKWGGYVQEEDMTPEQLALTDEIGRFFMREKVRNKEDYDLCMQDFTKWSDAWHKAEADAKKRLFKHMDAYIWRWWD